MPSCTGTLYFFNNSLAWYSCKFIEAKFCVANIVAIG
jgi:hypothetical protein